MLPEDYATELYSVYEDMTVLVAIQGLIMISLFVVLVYNLVKEFKKGVKITRHRVLYQLVILVIILLLIVFCLTWRLEYLYNCMFATVIMGLTVLSILTIVGYLYFTRVFFNMNTIYLSVENGALPTETQMHNYLRVMRVSRVILIIVILLNYIVSLVARISFFKGILRFNGDSDFILVFNMLTFSIVSGGIIGLLCHIRHRFLRVFKSTK